MADRNYFTSIPLQTNHIKAGMVLPTHFVRKVSRPWGITWAMVVGALQNQTYTIRANGYKVTKVALQVVGSETVEKSQELPFSSSTDWLLANELKPLWFALESQKNAEADWFLVLSLVKVDSVKERNTSLDLIFDQNQITLQRKIDMLNNGNQTIGLAAAVNDTDCFRLAS